MVPLSFFLFYDEATVISSLFSIPPVFAFEYQPPAGRFHPHAFSD